MSGRLLRFALATALLSSLAFAQDSKSSVSVNFTGVLNKNSSATDILQDPTNSGGFLANYRLNLSKHSGVDINYGYSRNSQNYAVSETNGVIQAGVHEFTAGYVYKIPFAKFTPFVTAGTGALVFHPTDSANNITGASTQAKAVFLYGAGLDYNISRSFALRAQYRGLVYKAPDFSLASLATDKTTHTAEPSVGIVFHF